MLTLMLWQHVVFVCVSRTLFRMSVIMIVRHMLWRVRLTLHSIQRTTIITRLILSSVQLKMHCVTDEGKHN